MLSRHMRWSRNADSLLSRPGSGTRRPLFTHSIREFNLISTNLSCGWTLRDIRGRRCLLAIVSSKKSRCTCQPNQQHRHDCILESCWRDRGRSISSQKLRPFGRRSRYQASLVHAGTLQANSGISTTVLPPCPSCQLPTSECENG